MISCYLIGKDTSVCVRFFTSDAETLKPWIDQFNSGPCHVHCHKHLDNLKDKPSCEDELRTWLGSSFCVYAVMLLDPRMNQLADPSFLNLCARAKIQGVFTALFM